MPPIPQAILDGMSDVEIQHFEHFRESYSQLARQKYGKLSPTAEIGIVQAALDYVNLWRMQAEQIASGKLVTSARQHPATALREWLRSAGLQERDLEPTPKQDEQAANRAALMALSND